ncbi:hypothetical protein PVK06_042991 [Gossypium arboreum]|uniref:Uncharacterized protein n=1 Tax=Gossypium arboreum TaxID=29729 RepID=A0ABR0MMB1_GOSAR|nr:hypothetical protein PVK06_042991 [Gossypium arboreum]
MACSMLRFRVASGVCFDIPWPCHDIEGSLEILAFYSLCCDVELPMLQYNDHH